MFFERQKYHFIFDKVLFPVNFATWNEPLTETEEAKKGLSFTLSHLVTAAIPPGNEKLISLALSLAMDFKPKNTNGIEEIKLEGQKPEALFRYPMKG